MNEPCFTDSCKQSPCLDVCCCCISSQWIFPSVFAISEMCTVQMTVWCTSLLLLARSNGVCDFITRALMWCSVSIFSTLLDYWDLMESQTAEFAPVALHLRWTHCGIHPLLVPSTPARCCLQCAKKGNDTKSTVLHEWMRQWHLEWCPGQEMLSLCFCWAVPNLLSWLIVRWLSSIMSRWPTFPRKAASFPDDLMVQGKECHTLFFKQRSF